MAGIMMNRLPSALAISLALTLALELFFFLIIGKRNKRDLLLTLLVNTLTNPVVVLTYWLLIFYTDWNGVIVKSSLELWAVLTEAHYYKKYGQQFSRPLLFSISANAFSFGTGMLLQKFIQETLL
jgi:hypothetical protein